MSNTESAAAGGLPKEPKPPTPIQIADRLNDVRHLVECAFMAAGTLDSEEANALQTVLDLVSKRLEKIVGLIGVDTTTHTDDAEGDNDE